MIGLVFFCPRIFECPPLRLETLKIKKYLTGTKDKQGGTPSTTQPTPRDSLALKYFEGRNLWSEILHKS